MADEPTDERARTGAVLAVPTEEGALDEWGRAPTVLNAQSLCTEEGAAAE